MEDISLITVIYSVQYTIDYQKKRNKLDIAPYDQERYGRN